MASTDGRPVPIKNTAYRVTFPIWDADGDLVTGATGLDSEVSLDGATFADCTNEATEIATSSGMYYLDLTSGEMNADTVAVIVKTSTVGAKTTPMVFYPEETGDINVDITSINNDTNGAGTTAAINLFNYIMSNITWNVDVVEISGDTTAADKLEAILDAMRANTAQAGAAGSITLDASASSVTDFYKGGSVLITGGTGVGQARLITAYNGTTKVATIVPSWATNPDNTSLFVAMPQGGSDTQAWFGTAIPGIHTSGYPVVTVKDGTGTGEIDTTSGGVLVSALAAQAKADVNAEVLDVLATDTFAELSGVPAATSTLKDKINWLFALARNKRTTTSTTETLRNDADGSNIATATISDNGTTFTKAEWS
jgi:hypothetical protein